MLTDSGRRTYGGAPAAAGAEREDLLERGLPLVRRMAFRMARRLPANVEVDDLIGAGMEGLVKAVDAYDGSRHPRFEPYAKARIRGAILDELRAGDSLTRYGRSRLGEVTRKMRELQQQLGRQPTEDEVARALGMPLEQYQRMSADLVRGPALGGAFGVAPDEAESGAPDPAKIFDEAELRTRLAQAIRALPERSQKVLALYYQEECTQAEIGEILGVTESRVCQILGETTARLRALLGEGPKKRSGRRSAASGE
ncbi:MAG: RNA polymerase sigma factor FliA [Myxococcales bacterium]|nr:RNA polymerase sigma factor FliA [Myxococcales bacterium]MDD9965681.1 RNA polymerase sigma factor FliA [Myxococcales bacterium]